MKRLLTRAARTLIILFFVHVPNSAALTIIRDFIGGEPGGSDVGGGNLVDIFNEAADRWEQTILDPHVITLHFGWAPVGGGTHDLIAQGGMPNRETEGIILFNNDNDPGHIHFYLDPTPHLDEEYLTFTENAQDLGGGVINIARVFLDPVGDAASIAHVDLLMIALHEIGHALGLAMANTSFIAESAGGDIDVTEPRPFPGTTIPLAFNLFGVTSHIDFIAYGTLMAGNTPGERRIPSAIDILANAQISQFNDLNLTGQPPADADGDGVLDHVDECPDSDLRGRVVIEECHTGVANQLVQAGCTISDKVQQCVEGAQNHGQFVSCVAHLTNDLNKAGTITGKEKGAIQSCAAQTRIP